MNNLNKKEKILLAILLAGCIAFLYVQLYLPNQTEKIDSLKSNISNYEAKLDSLSETSAMNVKLKKDLATLEEKYKVTIAAFPKEERDPEIAHKFDSYAYNNSTTLSSVTIGESQEFSEKKDNPGNNGNNNNNNSSSSNSNNSSNIKAEDSTFKLFIIPTTLTATGNYLNVRDFLSSIENDARLAKIETVTLSTNNNGKVTAGLTANYYYVPGVVENTEYPFNDGIKNKEDMFK